MSRCTSKAKTTGERCKNPPVNGYEVCRMHGVNRGNPGGGPRPGNKSAVTHGAFETLMREALPEDQRAAFDAVPVTTGLDAELRVLRFKLLRLLPDDVRQNMAVGFNVERIKADEPTKAAAISHLVGEIRKVVKEMKDQGGEDDPLARLVEDWREGMRSEIENGPQPQAT